MTHLIQPAFAIAISLTLTACNSSTPGIPGDPEDSAPFSLIGEGETVHFTGTEPFWGGEVTGDQLTYSTPENIDGTLITVSRFAGRGGLSFSGTLDGAQFDLVLVEGQCSDGMSDRLFPFVATLSIGESDDLRGCAWSSEHPFEGPENP
jgi:uncharacterized membrane protein